MLSEEVEGLVRDGRARRSGRCRNRAGGSVKGAECLEESHRLKVLVESRSHPHSLSLSVWDWT